MENPILDNALISIIVPVYNVEQYIPKCLDGILSQTYKSLEIILVDDGSTDSSGRICDEYAKKDKRIVVIHKENAGLSSARNAALDIATGKYIGFVDSDDWIDHNMYEILIKVAIKNNADIVNCGVIREYDDGKQKIVKSPAEIMRSETALIKLIENEELYDFVVNKLYKSNLWNNIRFPVGQYYEDIYTTYRTFLNANKIVCIKNNLYHYLQRTGSIVRSEFSEKQFHMLDAINEIKKSLRNNSKYSQAIKKRELKISYLILISALLDLSNEKLNKYKKRLNALSKILYKEKNYINKDSYFSKPMKVLSSLSFLPISLLKLIAINYVKISR